MRHILWKAAAVAAAAAILAMEPNALSIAGTGKAAHANIAIVYYYDGSAPVRNIPEPNVIGLAKALEGHAQLIAFLHTTGLKDKDVIALEGDVLRQGKGVEDFGVDCQLIVHVKNEEDVSMAGRCEVFIYDVSRQRQIAREMLIKPTRLDARGWHLISYDAEDGIAVYADEHIGAE